MQCVPFHIVHVFDDIDDVYWAYEYMLSEVVNSHAPMRRRTVRSRRPPFMNNRLRKAIYKKRMLRNRFKNTKSPGDWELYRVQRNHVNKIKRTSVRTYFYERCGGGPRSKDFWPTIKPFLSKKNVLSLM